MSTCKSQSYKKNKSTEVYDPRLGTSAAFRHVKLLNTFCLHPDGGTCMYGVEDDLT